MTDKTQIQISKDQWDKLNSMKECGDRFEDVVDRLIDKSTEGKDGRLCR